jgi:hypothetical protein
MTKRTRLKIGGHKFNEYLDTAIEANAAANQAIGEIAAAHRDDALTTELLLELLAVAATSVGQVHVALHKLDQIVRQAK